MTSEPGGPNVRDVRTAIAEVLRVPEEQVAGAIIIAGMSDGTYMLLHTAPNTAAACDVAMQVFAAKPHYHDQVIGVLL